MKFAKFTSLASWGAVAVLFCLWQPCQAQFSSNVQGTVTDSSGAVVPKVQITLHNIGTGVDLHEVTNGNGFYRFSSVAPDDYTVSTQAAGFKSESIAVTLTTGRLAAWISRFRWPEQAPRMWWYRARRRC